MSLEGTRLARLNSEDLAGHYRRFHRTHRAGHTYAQKREDPAKEVARGRILRLFGNRDWGRGLSIVTMPGLDWRFEKTLLAMRETAACLTEPTLPRRTFICALEADEGVFRSALKKMPGKEHGIVHKDALGCATSAVRTYYIQRFHRCRFEDFAFENQPKVDAAWIDFCGPLTEERVRALRHFWLNQCRYVLALTFQRGRSRLGNADECMDAVRDMCQGGAIEDIHVYGAPSSMVQVVLGRDRSARKRGR